MSAPTRKRRYTAAYLIAFHFGWDIKDVSECRYQNYEPAVYCIGDDYYCAPSSSKMPDPKRWKWTVVARYYDRLIYRCLMKEQLN